MANPRIVNIWGYLTFTFELSPVPAVRMTLGAPKQR